MRTATFSAAVLFLLCQTAVKNILKRVIIFTFFVQCIYFKWRNTGCLVVIGYAILFFPVLQNPSLLRHQWIGSLMDVSVKYIRDVYKVLLVQAEANFWLDFAGVESF